MGYLLRGLCGYGACYLCELITGWDGSDGMCDYGSIRGEMHVLRECADLWVEYVCVCRGG